jgi:mannose-6-phosphate isomerase-like protein (cupin superfamily)
MAIKVVNLAEKFGAFTEYYSPKIAGELNDSHIKLGKIKGDFMWHHHENEDELFLVVKGLMKISIREDGRERTLEVHPGELIVIPKGMEHMPSAEEETHIVMIEPKGTLNTGTIRNERTRETLETV